MISYRLISVLLICSFFVLPVSASVSSSVSSSVSTPIPLFDSSSIQSSNISNNFNNSNDFNSNFDILGIVDTIEYLKNHITNESIADAMTYVLSVSSEEEVMKYVTGNADMYCVQDFFINVLFYINVDDHCIMDILNKLLKNYGNPTDPRDYNIFYFFVIWLEDFHSYYNKILPNLKETMSIISTETTKVVYANMIENYYENWNDDIIAILPPGEYTYDCYQAYVCGWYSGYDAGFTLVYNNEKMYNYYPPRDSFSYILWKNDMKNGIYAHDWCIEGFMDGFETGKENAYHQQSLENDIKNQELLTKIYKNTNQIKSDVAEIKGIRQESLDLQHQQYNLQTAQLGATIFGWLI